MDYSTFLDAYYNEDHQRLDEILKNLRPRLIRFLEIHMGADKADAEDSVQQALLSLLNVLEADKLRQPEKLQTYILSACRNIYLNQKRKSSREPPYEELPKNHLQQPQQLRRLVEAERWEIVEQCIEKLKPNHRRFITYWVNHPTYKAKTIANNLNISVNYAWTLKHRVIKQLKECFQQKRNK